MTTTSKKCSKCGEVKGLDEFAANRLKKDGKRSCCKDCDKRYHEQNREKISEHKRQYYKQNYEKIIERNRQWRKRNREKHNEYGRQYREQNREKIIERNRQYRARQKAMREFFRMHKALAEITEALQQYMQP